jgi:hypothetical protein
MNEYRKLELGSLVKLAVDSRGITNGSIDILSFEYDIDSEIDKIVDYVDNNNFPELKNEVSIIKQENNLLEDKIKNFALEILSLQGNTEQLNQLIQEYNTTVADQYNNLVTLTYQILNKLEPKIIYKDKIIIQKEYIQTQTTYYRGVKTIDEVRKEQEVTVSGRRPKQKYGWFEYSDEWMVSIVFDKETFFMTKKDYQKAITLNIVPGGYGTQWPAKLFHKLYDK